MTVVKQQPTKSQMNNTVYTVTPPDLKLNVIGPSVLLLGITLADHHQYINFYDVTFPDVEITLFVGDEPFSAEYAPWYRAVVGMVSNIIVNVDNITIEELFLAMQAEHDGQALVCWLSQEGKNPILVSMLNSYQYRIFNSPEKIESFLNEEYS